MNHGIINIIMIKHLDKDCGSQLNVELNHSEGVNMDKLNDLISDYQHQLQKGTIQKAYREILGFISGLKVHLKRKYPEYQVSGLYQGYMDMTYFSFTPAELKERNLKIALVYLHEENRFEAWLSAVNRSVAEEYIQKLKDFDDMGYMISKTPLGVDYITTRILTDSPDFDDQKKLTEEIEIRGLSFIRSMTDLVDHVPK